MNLLKKVISLRENSDSEHEKPFLEHLEDLRKMIFRVVITLLISMVLCFTFQKQLLSVLRRPIDDVWQKQIEKTLPNEEDAPRAVSVDDWEKAKKIEQAASQLAETDRQAFYKSLGDADLAFHARCVALLRAAKALPDNKQQDFIRNLKLNEELTAQVLALNELGPETEVNARGNLKMMSSLKPTETFMLSMKLSFIAGIILALPVLLFFVLQFVLPGLHDRERKALWPALAIGSGLFLSGVCFAYFIVLPRALTFFTEWSAKIEVANEWRIGWYISFATNFTLLFGVAFELPVVVMLFVKLGMLSYDIMSRTRRYAIVAIFVLAAFITPTPDVMTLTLMAAPMIFLYECCIWLAWLDRKKQREREAEEAKEHEAWLKRRAAELSEAGGDDDDTTLSGDPYHDDYQDPHHDEHVEDHDPHEYDPYHHDDPEDYNWDDEYDQFHKDAEHKGNEEDESALDDEVGKAKNEAKNEGKDETKGKASEDSKEESKDDSKDEQSDDKPDQPGKPKDPS